MDSILIAGTVVCSFGAAYAVQKAALGMLLKAMGAPPAAGKQFPGASVYQA